MSAGPATDRVAGVRTALQQTPGTADFAALRRLLDGADHDEVVRAGRLLRGLDIDAVLAEYPATPRLSVAVTGHSTLAMLEPALAGEFARHGVLADVRLSLFDSYVFDLADPDSEVYTAKPDLVLCVLDPMIVADRLPTPWGPDEAADALDEAIAVLRRIAATFDKAGNGATLVLNTVPLPRALSAQLIDYRSRGRLGAVWRAANTRLLELADDHPAVVVIDLDPLVAEGVEVTDPRLSSYAKAHLSPRLLASYALEVGHLGRHLLGRGSKCLAVDLDGTLWGGVLGDDGVDGIEVSEGRRGEAFQSFGRVVKQFGAQGVLLAVVSKNEADLVREALRERAGLALREEDFVRIIANWRPKHDNLAELAEALNIGVDSLVFVDDNPAERGLVRRELPAAVVVDIDGDPALHARRLLADGWFDTRRLTAEDTARGSRYRDELKRQDFLDRFDSIQDYLRELGVRVRLAAAGDTEVPRVSQLTLRTNQFNLTAHRLQQSDVDSWRADPDALVLTVHAADRFGENGLVGALFLRHESNVLRIDNFVLSCRVFSRGIEQACLSAVLGYALGRGARSVEGSYVPTARNGVVADLYPRHGFAEVPCAQGRAFRHDLSEIPEVPDHLTFQQDFPGGAA
ncbi:HAD-IIIC family phosphatase [Amycolatopsis sp. NPDC004079]|uniref:HAD-IIIC family phosphatase n=1 Tax=Amycolatopsis sp. NPDC004079 TaxID=3154549 RepID=UPI0033B86931